MIRSLPRQASCTRWRPLVSPNRSFMPPSCFTPRSYSTQSGLMQFGPQLGNQNPVDNREDQHEEQPNNKKKGPDNGGKSWAASLESAAATGAGIMLLALCGLAYHKWYKWEALRKMSRAFAPGYDPVLELASASAYDDSGKPRPGRVDRKEADYIAKLINGEISGEYLLLMGPKGVGKTSMIIDAMVKNSADGVAMFECHEDPEVVRLRLGKALDFEYNEDSFAGLFSRKDPREGGAGLDIERALAKLEKVAIKYTKERGRPLVLVFNNIHFLRDDPEGNALLHQLQQRAEAWAQAKVCTIIFNSDDFHVYKFLKRSATRMHTLSVRDLTPPETHHYLKGTRSMLYPDEPPLPKSTSLRVWDLIGGRLAFLSRVVKHEDIVQAAQDMVKQEKEWLHSRLGLIPDHDDDVMDEQKWASCSFLLFQKFAQIAEEGETAAHRNLVAEALKAEELGATADGIEDEEELAQQIEDDLVGMIPEELDPKLTYRQAREVMTRPDYLVEIDHQNIVNIDAHHNVRPDSRLMLSVFRQIAAEEDFQEKLDNVMDRVSAIESLGRTRELTVKDANDLGGFLRLKIGQLTEKDFLPKEGEDDDKPKDEKVDAVEPEAGPRLV